MKLQIHILLHNLLINHQIAFHYVITLTHVLGNFTGKCGCFLYLQSWTQLTWHLSTALLCIVGGRNTEARLWLCCCSAGTSSTLDWRVSHGSSLSASTSVTCGATRAGTTAWFVLWIAEQSWFIYLDVDLIILWRFQKRPSNGSRVGFYCPPSSALYLNT